MTIAPISPPAVARGRFGPYGGQYVPETIMPALEELDAEFLLKTFHAERDRRLRDVVEFRDLREALHAHQVDEELELNEFHSSAEAKLIGEGY